MCHIPLNWTASAPGDVQKQFPPDAPARLRLAREIGTPAGVQIEQSSLTTLAQIGPVAGPSRGAPSRPLHVGQAALMNIAVCGNWETFQGRAGKTSIMSPNRRRLSARQTHSIGPIVVLLGLATWRAQSRAPSLRSHLLC